MGGLLLKHIVNNGFCQVSPAQIGVVRDVPLALLLMLQPESIRRDACSCHAGDLRIDALSRILIVDREGGIHPFRVLTETLTALVECKFAYETAAEFHCRVIEGITLKLTPVGITHAERISRMGCNCPITTH